LRAAGHRERVGDAPIATTRRVFLQRLGAALALGALPRCADADDWTRPPPPGPDLGIQLYTLRSILPQDFDGTLARLADVGYREVEFAGYHGRDPAAVRAALDAAGLRAPSAHVAIEALDAEWARTLEAAHAIGHEWLVVAWIPEELRPDLDGYRRIAERFNQAAATAREAGIGFAYHNHDFEFVPLEGRTPYDVLLEETDPELVRLELDLYWITKGGRDPLDYFARYPGRFPLVHVKDMGEDGGMVDVGEGTIDFARIIARREEAGIRHWFVEHDVPADPMRTARVSYENLRRLMDARGA
jgi:sugar phosphate isomerase/epimerase